MSAPSAAPAHVCACRTDRPPTAGGWCEGACPDRITGLLAWPDLEAALPDLVAQTRSAGKTFALAIGDVDAMKAYVEQVNRDDPDSFGHLAGNRLMADLGRHTKDWFTDTGLSAGCAATFGGDEVVIAAAVDDLDTFTDHIGALRDRLCLHLPCTVSFALGCTEPGTAPRGYRSLVADIDRTLFARKATRGPGEGGSITVCEAAPA